MQTLLALMIVAATFWLIVRRHDIRLVLLGGGLALASLAGRPLAVLDSFARSMVAAMVAPICAAMGFAAVLRMTGCDRHLVRLLLAPLRRRRWAVLPGGIVAAYLVNLAVPSQSSVAAMLGPILVPLLIAAGLRPASAGAALVLGSSFGGDLLNPAAQDVQALAGVTNLPPAELSARVIPASLAGLLTAVFVFTLSARRPTASQPVDVEAPAAPNAPREDAEGKIDPLKAVIPLVPVALLLVAHAGWTPLGWLLRVEESDSRPELAAAIPVVRALLIGFALAAAIGWRDLRRVVGSLFEGMGAAYRDVIALTIVAQCFGAGIAAVGLGKVLLGHFGGSRWGMATLSIVFPWGLATISGSGSGPVLAYAQACLVALGDRAGLPTLEALTCLAAAFGRTMSPVSAVVLCGAGLVGQSPTELIRRLLPALLAGAAVTFATTLSLG
jgi:DcuC family C4-dicarboxylate transporter